MTRSSRASNGGSRRGQQTTGASAAFAEAVGRALPGAVMSARRGAVEGAVGDDVFVRIDAGAVRFPSGEEVEPGTLGRDELRARIEQAWSAVAPAEAVVAHRAARTAWRRRRPVTQDDVRRIVLGFPGVTEGPAWGHPGFLFDPTRKSHFAWFGPDINNLLPPDNLDALILHCPDRPALLATRPDRYFTTPHYGDGREPGYVITRLSEHRGKDDRAELAELLEDAWRGMR